MRKLENPVDEGWIVHIYGRDRQLLCALESSHGWAFCAGWVFGLLLAIVWFNLAPATHPTHHLSKTYSSPIEAPLALD